MLVLFSRGMGPAVVIYLLSHVQKNAQIYPAIIAVNVSEENIDMVSLEIVYIFIRLSMWFILDLVTFKL